MLPNRYPLAPPETTVQPSWRRNLSGWFASGSICMNAFPVSSVSLCVHLWFHKPVAA
jgi:hypothetical protein